MQVESMQFSGYDIVVNAVNNAPTDIPGGEISLNVLIKVVVWVDAYSITAPLCEVGGTSCTEDGILMRAKERKTLKVSIGDKVPPVVRFLKITIIPT
jgi:hypothetical protein